jgi:hypothetical protein
VLLSGVDQGAVAAAHKKQDSFARDSDDGHVLRLAAGAQRLGGQDRETRPCVQVRYLGVLKPHVLGRSWSLPRRRDGAEVIGEALGLAAVGEGQRQIARRLGRLPGTVCGWMLAAKAHVLRFGRQPAGPWQTAVWMTGGLLCGPLALAP